MSFLPTPMIAVRRYSTGTKMQLRILPPTAFDRCPLPVVSSTKITSPAPITRASPSLAVICTPARCGMPVEIVIRLHLAEDDAGGGQPLGQLAGAALLDPFDLDVAEMRLALGIGIKIVDPHRRLLGLGSETDCSGGAGSGASAIS